jgi:hypothetical protein
MTYSSHKFTEFSKNGRGDLIATPDGIQWLQDHEPFVETMAGFTNTEKDTELFFNDKPEVLHVDMGSNSSVFSVDGVALKMSTPYSGRQSYEQSKPVRHENLFNQFTFAITLADKLKDQSDIMTPKQYFALHSPVGNLRVEELIPPNWTTFGKLATDGGFTNERTNEMNQVVKNRIIKVAGRLMTASMDFDQTRRNHNVLVEETAIAPENAPLYIIDQPSSRILGRILFALLYS